MSDDAIRAVLVDLARVTFGTPTGFQSVLESEVTARGEDPDSVRAWVVAHGGRLKDVPPHRSQTAGEPRWQVVETPSDVRYLIPSAALEVAEP